MARMTYGRRRWALVCCVICMVLTLGMASYSLFLAWQGFEMTGPENPVSLPVSVPSQEVLRVDPVPVEGIDPDLPIVALTVDDSVTPLTEEYCRVLLENDCKATFFVVGYLAEQNPELVTALADAGMELGNHSYSHQQLAGLRSEKVQSQISQADELIYDLIGQVPALLRPPYGRVSGDVLEAARRPVVLWSVDSRDAVAASAAEVLDQLLSARDGDIIRVHDGMEITLEALEKGLPALREAGIQVTTVSGLFAVRGYGMQEGVRYDALPGE